MNNRYSSIYLVNMLQGLYELKYAKCSAWCGCYVNVNCYNLPYLPSRIVWGKKNQLKFAFFETRAQFYPMTMDDSDHRSNLVSIRSSMVLLSTNNITPTSFLWWFCWSLDWEMLHLKRFQLGLWQALAIALLEMCKGWKAGRVVN